MVNDELRREIIDLKNNLFRDYDIDPSKDLRWDATHRISRFGVNRVRHLNALIEIEKMQFKILRMMIMNAFSNPLTHLHHGYELTYLQRWWNIPPNMEIVCENFSRDILTYFKGIPESIVCLKTKEETEHGTVLNTIQFHAI